MPPILDDKRTRIAFHFRAEGPANGPSAIEKADSSGRQRRYLQGVSSGLKVDAHGERMTDKAIESFMVQAKSGDLLLYADVHGVSATKDIGILDDARILENGDWFTEYRLYDEFDSELGVDKASVETASKLWLQVNGLPPYTKPKSKGFSIEGFVPDERGAMEMTQTGRKAINEVKLDGIVVVPRPAYEDSIANAVYKALGENLPGMPEKTIESHIRTMVEQGEQEEEYFRQRYLIDDAASDLVRRIMSEEDDGKRRERLEAVYQEHGSLMTDLVLRHPDAFAPDTDMAIARSADSGERAANLQKALLTSLGDLETLFGGGNMVHKALTPEERAILQNVQSLLDQLDQATAGGANAPAEQVASDMAPSSNKSVAKGATMDSPDILKKIMNGEALSDEEKLSVIQSLGGGVVEAPPEETPPETPPPEEMGLAKDESTASDSAEARLGDQEETTDDAIAEVGDNMKNVLKAIGPVIVAAVAKALEPISAKVDTLDKNFDVMAEGFGVTEEVLKGAAAAGEAKVEKAVADPEAVSKADLEGLLSAVSKSAPDEDQILIEDNALVEPFQMRKSATAEQGQPAEMGSLVTSLFGN